MLRGKDRPSPTPREGRAQLGPHTSRSTPSRPPSVSVSRVHSVPKSHRGVPRGTKEVTGRGDDVPGAVRGTLTYWAERRGTVKDF